MEIQKEITETVDKLNVLFLQACSSDIRIDIDVLHIQNIGMIQTPMLKVELYKKISLQNLCYQNICHTVFQASSNGDVWYLCDKEQRIVNPKKESYTLLNEKVTCPNCIKILKTLGEY